MLDARKFQIESAVMEHYKECLEYHDELKEYAVGAYFTCLNKVTHAVTEEGFEAIISILTKLRRSLVSIEPTYQKIAKPSSDVSKALKVETQLPVEEGVPTDDPI